MSSLRAPADQPFGGPLDIVLDPTDPRPRRSLPGQVWLLAFVLWASGFLGVGFAFTQHQGALRQRALQKVRIAELGSVIPAAWWGWLALSGAGAIVCATACVLQRRR